MTLSPSGAFSGITSGYTTYGSITFTNLRILSANTFTLQAACASANSATSASFSVVNYVYSIALASSTNTPSVNFLFNIIASLKGEDGNAFTGSCAATLTESSLSLQGAKSLTILTTGEGTFGVYFTSSGSKTVIASCPAVDASPTIYQSIILNVLGDKLLITSISPTVYFI